MGKQEFAKVSNVPVGDVTSVWNFKAQRLLLTLFQRPSEINDRCCTIFGNVCFNAEICELIKKIFIIDFPSETTARTEDDKDGLLLLATMLFTAAAILIFTGLVCKCGYFDWMYERYQYEAVHV